MYMLPLKNKILWPEKKKERFFAFLLCHVKACAYSPCSQKATQMCQLKDESIHGKLARRNRRCMTDKYSICGNRFVVKGFVKPLLTFFLWLTQSLQLVVSPYHKESRADHGILNPLKMSTLAAVCSYECSYFYHLVLDLNKSSHEYWWHLKRTTNTAVSSWWLVT